MTIFRAIISDHSRSAADWASESCKGRRLTLNDLSGWAAGGPRVETWDRARMPRQARPHRIGPPGWPAPGRSMRRCLPACLCQPDPLATPTIDAISVRARRALWGALPLALTYRCPGPVVEVEPALRSPPTAARGDLADARFRDAGRWLAGVMALENGGRQRRRRAGSTRPCQRLPSAPRRGRSGMWCPRPWSSRYFATMGGPTVGLYEAPGLPRSSRSPASSSQA